MRNGDTVTAQSDDPAVGSDRVVRGLAMPAAYPFPVASVEHRETHISHVFLAGDFAYKLKKPIKTDFLDYSTLSLRHHFCDEELRLDCRYSGDLYIGVVPITDEEGGIRIEGDGEPIEYAVKMRRFPDEALLSHRVDAGLLSIDEVQQLAITIAQFHARARHCSPDRAKRVPSMLRRNIQEILETLKTGATDSVVSILDQIGSWSDDFFCEHESEFRVRVEQGFIRECHGDLHLQNIVHFDEKLIPFDGIEFNDDFRFIDVLNDTAFLAMDLDARGHLDLSRSFINCYLEHTGDYESLVVMRWYLVYRALIRAMVAKMKAAQHEQEPHIYRESIQDNLDHIDLARQYTNAAHPTLYITHGLSGSGKTTLSENVVMRYGAIRLRSDIERKRHFGLSADDEIDQDLKQQLYSKDANQATYDRLHKLARGLLRSGYPVIVDATFLKQSDRQTFQKLAKSEGVRFAILDCHADVPTLRQRITDRIAKGKDASDADLSVLQLQLESQEVLTPAECESVIDIPDRATKTDGR